ncbi:MAG: hypothetical protein PF505_05975 [Vallitaleaceae bacterium]|nr:hypothetical protein [Vallitaleaceae bacterium]
MNDETSKAPDMLKEIVALKNYISINQLNNSCSYGGNQGWFHEIVVDVNKEKAYHKGLRIKKYGCGLISATDVLLYINQNNAEWGETTLKQNQVDMSEYKTLVAEFDRHYFRARRNLGVLGPFLSLGFKKYIRNHKLRLKIKWGTFYSSTTIYKKIVLMLKKDVPVIISIGPSRFGDKSRGIALYVLKPNSESMTSNEGNQDKVIYEAYKTIKGHYVVVTGIFLNEHNKHMMLRISSWGKLYYMDWEEYRNYHLHHSMPFTSSILTVEKVVVKS